MDNSDDDVLTPYSYFKRYIPDEVFAMMADMTNLYATQCGTRGYRPTTADEMEVLTGLHIVMGCMKFPRVRMYWESSVMLKLIEISRMTRDRFVQLRVHWHFVNNLENPGTDVFKVRPLYNSLLKRCRALDMEQDLSVDEQMVPFTGTLSVKQYIKGKPNPWGVKLFSVRQVWPSIRFHHLPRSKNRTVPRPCEGIWPGSKCCSSPMSTHCCSVSLCFL